MDDATLLARAGRGDERAFAELYARHQPALYRYARHMCGDAADDIVQEAFLAVIRRPNGYQPARGSVAQYLFGIARHHARQRIGAMFEPPAEDGHVVETITPLDELLHVESVAQLRDAIATLPPVYREVVVLCELEEMTYQDAASLLDCAIGTIRSRLHRARAQLANTLRGHRRAVAGDR